MGPIGIPELIVILVILLVIFGPKRLPGLGRSLGTGMREFKESISGENKDSGEERKSLEPAAAQSTATVTPASEREETPVSSDPRA